MMTEYNVNIPTTSLHRILNAHNFTTKNLYHEPKARNTADNIQQRAVHSRSMLSIPPHSLIYIDESGFNLHTNRKRGKNVCMHVKKRGKNVCISMPSNVTI